MPVMYYTYHMTEIRDEIYFEIIILGGTSLSNGKVPYHGCKERGRDLRKDSKLSGWRSPTGYEMPQHKRLELKDLFYMVSQDKESRPPTA